MQHQGLYVVNSPGGEWSNDDFALSGPLGVFSTYEKAKEAIKRHMVDEMKACTDSDDDYHSMEFEELQEVWCEQMEIDEMTIHLVPFDNDLSALDQTGNVVNE